ncbi:MAG: transglutaminase family protein, partial [Bryobacterales bacterium]|nr:transglutaminase family protein [Bryobacterales bacterium]
MPIRVALHHKTTYHYDRLVTLSPQVIRLRPAPHCRTRVTSYSLKIEPRNHFLNWQQDPQSNYLARAVFPEKTRSFTVEVDLVAEMTVVNPFDFFLEPSATDFPFAYEPALKKELAPFLEIREHGPRLRELLASVDRTERRSIDFLVEINQRLQRDIRYLIRMEPGVQTCEQTLERASGSCRDSAWLLVQLLRHLGLAARFVSGYLIQLRADEKPLEGPAGTEQDFTDLHAWTEVYLPGAGWIGLDPTSGMLAGEGHLPIAATPDPSSAAPIAGAVEQCEVEFAHEMKVTRIHEDPRVTLPYSDDQWSRIEALGHQVDAALTAQDVRLTMGGEPTFVSIDDMDGEQWNTAALGHDKRVRAEDLLDRLRVRYAEGGLLHYGQGKWYPGEPLPRWALAIYWRRDGIPLWRNRDLIARAGEQHNQTPFDAQRFAETLAARLGVDPDYVNAAFEDPLHYLQQERTLPINLDPIDNKLESTIDRERVRRVFERGLNTPVGYVLPIQRGWGKSGPEWQTGLWMLRGQHLFLMPGDSPVGFRLPLPSLPWVSPALAPIREQVDPMINRAPLPIPERRAVEPPVMQRRGGERDRVPKPGEPAP